MDARDSNLDLLFSEVRRLGLRMAELETRVGKAIDSCREQLDTINLSLEMVGKQVEQLRARFEYLELSVRKSQ